MKVVIGLFETHEEVKRVVAELQEAGFDKHSLALLTATMVDEIDDLLKDGLEETTAEGALLGSAIGSVLGLLGGVAVLPIPGFGPALVSGMLATASGGVMGGFFGSLFGSRTAVEEEYDFKEELADGGVLVIVQIDETNEEKAQQIMRQSQGELVDTYEVEEEELDTLPEADTDQE